MIKHLILLKYRYDEHQRGLPAMVDKIFDKKISNAKKGTGMNSENKELFWKCFVLNFRRTTQTNC